LGTKLVIIGLDTGLHHLSVCLCLLVFTQELLHK